MRVEYAAAAVAEVEEALLYYEAIDPALRSRLLQQIDEAVRLIQRFPEGWRPIGEGLRQRRLKSFPYAFVYAARGESIVVLAFASSHRKPGYWQSKK